MEGRKTLQLVSRLADRADRPAAASALARHLGADALLLFVRDPELNAFLPAPGLVQTLPGGPGWNDLLRRCEVPGEYPCEVAFPDKATRCQARAFATGDGLVLTLLGGRPDPGPIEWLCLPLLANLLRAELATGAAKGREAAARAEVRQAATLTSVLDATRAELERTLNEARRLNTELKSADRAKDEFLAMLGHELRNPLAPIATALRLMELRGDPATRREREVVTRQVSHLTRLVEDLLDVSRITQGKIELKREPLELSEIVAKAIEMASPLIEGRQHKLRVAVPPRGLVLDGDPVRLAQVVSNLLSNAAKYTEPRGEIFISGAREGAEAMLRVRDSGIGISPEMLPRIFETFMQEPQSLARSQGGLGLGLAIVRSIVALHGGRVEAYSEGREKGSEFVVRLPLRLAAAVGGAAARVAVEQSRALPEAGRRRILIVDDNVDAAEMLAEVLESLGHATHVAHDGPSALEAALAFQPEIGLLDIGLPVMDGYELARRMQATPELGSTRLVALTGYGQEGDRQRTFEAGFEVHLVKPVELDELLALIERMACPIAQSPGSMLSSR